MILIFFKYKLGNNCHLKKKYVTFFVTSSLLIADAGKTR